MTFRIHRAIACAFALAAVGLFAAGAAPAADGDTGTVVIHQRSSAGSPAEGGCYNVVKLDGDDAGHWTYVCDDDDDADDGEVTIDELPPSGYRRHRRADAHTRAAAAAPRRDKGREGRCARRLLLGDPDARRRGRLDRPAL
jgi:hypothetical protein